MEFKMTSFIKGNFSSTISQKLKNSVPESALFM